MSEDIKLTFDVEEPDENSEDPTAAIAQQADDALAAQAAEATDLADEESLLSPEELAQVDEFSKRIDVHSTNAILQYGSGAQKKMADFSETALSSVRTQDLGEVGDLLAGVVTDLRGFDAEGEKGLRGFFKRGANKMEGMRAKYDEVEGNIEKTVKVLQTHQKKLMKDAAMLDKLYDLNLQYFKELSMYILAGKKALKTIREGELADLRAKALASGRTEDAQAVQDLEAKCNRLEKKVSDLQLTRTIAMQTAPQIRLVQNSEAMMIEKIQSTIVNTIPLWKSQMVLALGMENSTQAVKAQNAVTEATNELLRKNADLLHQNTVDVARESERGIVDIETLKHTNEELIKTFDEVLQVQAEGREKRQQAEAEIQRIEGELRAELLKVHG
ncbi:MAG: toxic anion resistance protein [Eggerthellaceae bacterium]|jgi:uncharacterized protein YaaN involved in tellurite resistance